MVMTFASKSNSVAAPSCAVSIRNSKRVLPRKTPSRLVKPQNEFVRLPTGNKVYFLDKAIKQFILKSYILIYNLLQFEIL